MADWNPNTTNVKGLEWSPHTDSSVTLDALTKVAAMSVLQTTAQVIGAERVYVSALPTRGGLYAVEVYDNETADASAGFTTTQTAYPNEDVAGVGTTAGLWAEDDDTVSTIYDQIDETGSSGGDYIFTDGISGATLSSGYSHRYSTAGLTLASERILAVQVQVYFRRKNPGTTTLYVNMSIGGVEVTIGSAVPGTSEAWYYFTLNYNPVTLRPWTIADVQAFDSTDEVLFYVQHSSVNVITRIHISRFVVISCDETRIAVGALDDTASALTVPGWCEATMTTPTGGAWTKDGAGRHLYLVRRISNSGSMVIPYQESDVAPNPATGWPVVLEPFYGTVQTSGIFFDLGFSTMGTANGRLFGLLQRTTAPADSVDSQPYAAIKEAAVFTGQDAEQEFSNAAATNYAGLRFLAYPTDTATADLLVKVKRRSDNVQLGGTLTLTAAAVRAQGVVTPGTSYRLIEDRLVSVAGLATATQYYIEFSSTAANAAAGWVVRGLDTIAQGDTATFGGTTDRAVINASEADRYDIPATLFTVPSTPTGLATTVTNDDLPGVGAGCDVDHVEFIDLTWNATALGGTFDYYEIQRTLDSGVTWETVAIIGTEATVDFDDYETPRGVAAGYRMRVARTDGAYSDWTSTSTKTASALGCEMIFTTNQDPTLTVALNRDPEIEYEFLDAEEVVFVPIYGRDYQAAFQPTEQRGVRFTIPLTVSAVATPATRQGVPVYDALRAIATADLPYVAVLDQHGNRFLAALQVPTGPYREPGKLYIAQITVTEVTAAAAPLEV